MYTQILRYNYLIISMIGLLFSSCGSNPDKATGKDSTEVKQTQQAAVPEQEGVKKHILFFGTSLTAGLGVDPEQAFPALVQDKVDSLKLPYQVINGGLSGETSAAGKNRIDWLLRQSVDIFVLELGANDGLRGIPVTETRKNLQEIIDKVKNKYPNAKLVMAGMQMPPSMGEKYTTDFKNLFPEIARKNQMELIPFLLKDVGGIPSLIQQDGLHPNPAGHQILANNVWAVLQPLL